MMTRKEVLRELRNVEGVEAWIRLTDDDGAHVEVKKSAVRRMFRNLSDEDYNGDLILYKVRIQNGCMLIDC